MTGPSRPRRCRPGRTRCARGGAARPIRSTASSSRAYLVDRYSGVQVVRDHLGLDVEQPPEVLDALGERAQGLVVLQVPDVVGDEGVPPAGQAERVLQLGAAGQHRPREAAGDGRAARARSRGSAAAASARPRKARTTESSVRTWIGPVVGQERVGDARQPCPWRRRRGRRSARRRRSRWSARSAGPRAASSRWCSGVYGSMTPSWRLPGRPVGGRGRARRPGRGGAQQHDRAGRAGQQGGGRGVDLGQRPRRGQVGDHDRERLVLAVLARRGARRRPARRRRRRPGGSRRGP